MDNYFRYPRGSKIYNVPDVDLHPHLKSQDRYLIQVVRNAFADVILFANPKSIEGKQHPHVKLVMLLWHDLNNSMDDKYYDEPATSPPCISLHLEVDGKMNRITRSGGVTVRDILWASAMLTYVATIESTALAHQRIKVIDALREDRKEIPAKEMEQYTLYFQGLNMWKVYADKYKQWEKEVQEKDNEAHMIPIKAQTEYFTRRASS